VKKNWHGFQDAPSGQQCGPPFDGTKITTKHGDSCWVCDKYGKQKQLDTDLATISIGMLGPFLIGIY
jgi:hypothetical protein